MGKTLLVYDMNLREMENYEKIYTDIGERNDTGISVLYTRVPELVPEPSLGNPALHCSTVRIYNHVIFDSLSLQNKTSHQHMIKYQNAKRRSRGQREYERIVKVRLTRVHLNMYCSAR